MSATGVPDAAPAAPAPAAPAAAVGRPHPPNQPLPSLRARVLAHVLLPLALAWLAGGVVSVVVASVFSQHAFDRALLDNAQAVAVSMRVVEGRLDLGLSTRGMGALLYDQSESVYFAVRGADGALIAGHAGLYAPAPEEGASYRFSDVAYQGHALRAVHLRRTVPAPFAVVMAETTSARRALLRNVLVFAILPELALLALLAFWLRRAIGRDLAPLAALQEAVDRRDVRDLAPVPAAGAVREVERLGGAVNALFARVREGVAAQREFAGNVAHELRTPLAGIRALAEYGLAQDDPAVWREQLARIAQSEQRASHLVEQLLALARADEGAAMALVPVALERLVHDAVLRVLPRADALGVDLGARGVEEAVAVRAHPALLEGILGNLLDNALRYARTAEAGAPPPTVTVDVQVDAAAGTATLAVIDNGPGIPEAQRERLRARWAQGPEGAWLGQGVGLGLAIVGRYAALLEAPFRLLPGPGGRGLAATITLPLAA